MMMMMQIQRFGAAMPTQFTQRQGGGQNLATALRQHIESCVEKGQTYEQAYADLLKILTTVAREHEVRLPIATTVKDIKTSPVGSRQAGPGRLPYPTSKLSPTRFENNKPVYEIQPSTQDELEFFGKGE